MRTFSTDTASYCFAPLHAALKRNVDQNYLAGASHTILLGRNVVDTGCVGWADKEAGVALRPDHIFRIMSNTKLVTTCAVMLLVESGRIALDDPIERYIPQLGRRQVLRPGASVITDTEPARNAITVRHLLSHTSGLSYGLLDPGTMIFKAYREARVLDPWVPLAGLMDVLADLPLLFHPGTAWEYSVATDVLGRLIEVISGQRLDAFFEQRITGPLGMPDTSFVLPPEKQPRLVAYYAGVNLLDPNVPNLKRVDHLPWPGAYVQPAPLQKAGGGMVSTLADMVALVRSLLPGGPTLLKPESIAEMMRDQLPAGSYIRFAQLGEVKGKGFGLGGSVTHIPSSIDPPGSEGEFQWGGMAGTHWWISPKANLAGVLMAQRFMGFWNPYAHEFKRLAYEAVTKPPVPCNLHENPVQ